MSRLAIVCYGNGITMALRRRRAGRRAARRGRRVYRRRNYRRAVSRVHTIKRMGQSMLIQEDGTGAPIVTQNATTTLNISNISAGLLPSTYQFGGSIQFRLNAVADYADLTQLFDRYKITGVKVKMLYQQNIADAQSVGALPVMWFAQDFDDSVVPTSSTDVQVKQYAKTRILNGNREFSVFIRPRLSKVLAADALAGAGASSERPCFVDCAYPQVPHYGLKFWIDGWHQGSPSQEIAQALRIQTTYYLKLKDTQ